MSRGGSQSKNFTTTNLVNHLKRHHVKEYNEFIIINKKKQQELDAVAKNSSTSCNSSASSQLTLSDMMPWSASHRETIRFNGLVTKMIARDSQPYTVVENAGFRELMSAALPRYKMPGRTFFADKGIPSLFESVKGKIKTAIQMAMEGGDYISFTTDIWSRSAGKGAMMSLTAHYTCKDGKPRVLCIAPFTGSHTGQAISDLLIKLLGEWSIPSEKVHAVVTDNGANVKCGLRIAELPGIPCAIHTLQLVVNKGLKAQRTIIDAISRSRKIAAHFKHSAGANERLSVSNKK